MNDKKEFIIKETIKNTSAHVYDIYAQLYDRLMESEQEAGETLRIILEETQKRTFKDEGEAVLLNGDDVHEVMIGYFPLLREYVRALSRENPDVSTFYRKLYETVFCSPLFPEDCSSKRILLYLLGEKLSEIPYYQAVELLEMDGERYKDLVMKMRPQLQETIYMLNRRFDYRTEEASQIFRIMSDLEGDDQKIVFLAAIIEILRQGKRVKRSRQDRV